MKERLKIGYIGVGRRGFGVLKACVAEMNDVDVTMVCDLHEPYFDKVKELYKDLGKPEPAFTTNYHEVLDNPEIDGVFIMTGWEGRTAIVRDCMLAGKRSTFEVGCAFDLSECYELLDVYERTKVPFMMLENCCYGRYEMMAMNMHDQGLFGEVFHCDGAYRHDLIECRELLSPNEDADRHYRIRSYMQRNCEQYPTHALGPIAKLLHINRGNKMLTLSSFASKSVSLKERAKMFDDIDDKWKNFDYKQGDIITTVITCANGETIRLTEDTTAPVAYYSRDFTVRGSKGMCSEEWSALYLEGKMDRVFDNLEKEMPNYDHPLHKQYVAEGERGGHGGMDWLVCRAFIESVKNETMPPIDPYDSLTLLAIAPLSEASINRGGAPVDVPDFTRGKWLNREPITEGKYCLDKVCEDPDTPIFPE